MARTQLLPVNAATLLSDINNRLSILNTELNNTLPRTSLLSPNVLPGVNDGAALLGTLDANGQDVLNVKTLSVTSLTTAIDGQLVDVTAILTEAAFIFTQVVASEQAALLSEQTALLSEQAAATSATLAASSQVLADSSQVSATASEAAALLSEQAAAASKLASAVSQAASLLSAQNAALSEVNADASAVAALASEQATTSSQLAAAISEANALASEQATTAALSAVGNPIPLSQKGTASGVAETDTVNKILNVHLPATALTQDIPLAQKGALDGVAPLVNGIVPATHLPSLAVDKFSLSWARATSAATPYVLGGGVSFRVENGTRSTIMCLRAGRYLFSPGAYSYGSSNSVNANDSITRAFFYMSSPIVGMWSMIHTGTVPGNKYTSVSIPTSVLQLNVSDTFVIPTMYIAGQTTGRFVNFNYSLQLLVTRLGD